MNESEFWHYVTATDLKAEVEAVAETLKQKLIPLDNQALADFDKFFSIKMRQSYLWELWGAAYVTAGCDSEYAFAEFRCWLISRGQAIFEAALKNPDSLANHDIFLQKNDMPYPYLDEYDLIAGLIYEERTGEELPFVPSGLSEPKGKRFKDKTKVLKTLYPNLFAKFWIGG
jgi:hypothetical protein